MSGDVPNGPPEGSNGDDAAWAQIVASLRADPPSSGSWPASEDVPDTTGTERPDRDAPSAEDDPDRDPDTTTGGDAADSAQSDDGPSTPDGDTDQAGPPGPAGIVPPGPIVVWRGPTRDPDELAEAEREDHFVPPEPPPLPRTDAFTSMAWAGTLGGPAFLVLAAILGWDLAAWAATLAVVAFLVGAGVLVARMRQEPRDDDGAVV